MSPAGPAAGPGFPELQLCAATAWSVIQASGRTQPPPLQSHRSQHIQAASSPAHLAVLGVLSRLCRSGSWEIVAEHMVL